ncbi:MAG: molybdopterin converting factor subunit 1 [Burkholderiales bacterium]|nr:molybdopterin converting factor subunit 1 [Burkholderiales bacterium]
MNLTVRYFASIREAAGTASELLDTEAGTIAELRAELRSRGGALAEALAPGRAVRMALNQQLVHEHAGLTEGDEVAFFPPVTGG